VRALTMANFSRGWIVFATMIVAPTLFFLRGESGIAFAQSVPTSCSTSTSTSTGFSYGSQANFDGPSSTYFEGPPPCPTGSDSSAGSITDVANQRFNQMITNRVLGTVLLGITSRSIATTASARSARPGRSPPVSTAART